MVKAGKRAPKKEVKKDAPKYKIVRDWDILELKEGKGLTVKEIVPLVGLSESTVRHTLDRFEMIGERGDEHEYIDLGLELCGYLDEAGLGSDIDRCMSLILNELWVNGYNTRVKIAKITVDQRMEIGSSHRFARLGVKGANVFDAWLKDLKAESKVRVGKKSKK